MEMDDWDGLMLLYDLENAELEADAAQRVFHARDDAFLLSDVAFERRFRLTKRMTDTLIQRLEELLPEPTRTTAIDVQTSVLATLMFLGCGGYQLGVGESVHLAISQSSVSRSLEIIVDAINTHFMDDWVSFPMDNTQPIKQGFNNEYRFPGVIGAIDGTHVAIMAPPADDPAHPEHIYVNRKHYHSINTQLICDNNMKILHVNANFPGSTNDSYIWRQSNIRAALQEAHDDNVSSWLLGDSGYPLEPWLFIPLGNAVSDGELRYNRRQMRARSIVERCNGLLKMQWRCLLRHRVLHYRPEKASKIITACCVLHNMCVENNLAAPHDEPHDGEFDLGMDVEADPLPMPAGNINPILANGRRLQRRLIQRSFDQQHHQ